MIDKSYAGKISKINILKESAGTAKIIKSGRKLAYYAAVIAVEAIFLIAISVYMKKVEARVSTTLLFVERKVHVGDAPKDIRLIEKEAKMIRAMTKSRDLKINIVREIANRLPSDVWLTELMVNNNGTDVIKGESFTASSVMRYMSSISSIQGVKSVRFENGGLRKSKDGTYKFVFLITESWHKKKRGSKK